MSTRSWDAASYDRIGGPMTQMASEVVERLRLRGDEVVLDAGCGTGRATQMLVDRLPRGQVLAVDADSEMVRVASANLGPKIDVRQVDLLELELEKPVDAIFSTATFHWILDHDRLFRRLYAALAPAGQLVAQCGGRGNIAEVRRAAAEVATDERFSPSLADWRPSSNYAGAEETAERLEAVGFVNVQTWLEPREVTPDDPAEYLTTINLGAYVQRLPAELQPIFIDTVLDRLERPLTIDYVRLNIAAEHPGH